MSQRSRRIFITGTDTGVGKTWLTAQAIRSLLQAGQHARAFKPVACGSDQQGRNDDIEILRKAQNLSAGAIHLYQFRMPAAPSQAAAAEQHRIEPLALVQWCEQATAPFDSALIEAIGGLMVPLTPDYLVRDWLADMPDYEVWLVVGCRLGAINHTLLSLSALQNMGRSPKHIFLNAPQADDSSWLQPIRQAILPFVDKDCEIHTLSHQPEVDKPLDFATML